MRKRILSALLALVLVGGLLPASGLLATVTAAGGTGEESNFTNLVIFCRFQDEEEFIHETYDGSTVVEILDNTYNKSTYSVADYFSTVSGGRMQMNTLFLFDTSESGEQASVQLSRKRGYYAEASDDNPDGYTGSGSSRISELSADWGDAVNAAITRGARPVDAAGQVYPFSHLDRNGDGNFDLVTIIYKYTTQNLTVSHASPLWDYQTVSTRMTATEAGRTYQSYQYVQLTCNYQNQSGALQLYKGTADQLPILAPGKLCHETMHALGPKDLYSSSSTNHVGYLSLMDKHFSPVGQFVTVKERESLGWLGTGQVQTLPGSGTFTLQEASSPQGVVTYKLALSE